MNKKLCPCQSKRSYIDCCEKYHLGKKKPQNAKDLMRSRFCAYALSLSDYIIKTSHPKNACFQKDLKTLKEDILRFCKDTSFENLEILDFIEEKEKAFVTFIAYLKAAKKDLTFTEISHFEKQNGKWLYKDGQLFEGIRRDL
ncbi:MAG: hypothetical protein K940chlam5_00437 [Candidatus Anoxychlamydiales bacterium]|nr:hypothetical protein [Candidatus Anoxychlamydiales bacterium]